MAKLGDVCFITMGQSPDSATYNESGNGLPFFQGNADFGKINPTARIWCSEPKKIANPDDILISVRAPIGALNIADIKCCIGRGLASLNINDDKGIKKYIWYALKSKANEMISKGTGSTFKAIGKDILYNLEIPLPPLGTQCQMAENLDKVTRLIDLCNSILDRLDLLVKSRFVEMFGNKNYPIKRWNDVFNTTTGKLDSNAMDEEGAYPFFTCAKEASRINTYAFDEEALLLAGNNAAGKYDVKYYCGKFNAYQRTYVLTLKQNWSYVLFKCQLEDKLEYLQAQSLGGLTKYLTLKILGELDFIVPPLDLQTQFSAFVEQTDKSKSAVKKVLEKAETLKKALMQEYFG